MVPKRVQEDFGESPLSSLFIVPGFGHGLWLYAPKRFQELGDRLQPAGLPSEDHRNFNRLYYARAERVDFDAQGRIRIPDRLKGIGKIGREVVLIGVQDHAEIWDAGTWNEYLTRQEPEFEQITSRAFGPR